MIRNYALNSECALNRKGLDIEGGAILLLRSRWKSILSRVSFEDITSILRAFDILYWESSSLLRERMPAIVMTDITGHLDRLLQLGHLNNRRPDFRVMYVS